MSVHDIFLNHTFLRCICRTGQIKKPKNQYDFPVPLGKFGLPSMGKAEQLQEQRYPFLSVCAVFSCVQTMAWLPVFGSFNVHTHVEACNCTRGLYWHRKRVCTGSWDADSGRKIPCCTGDSNLHQYHAWLFSRRLYQLSCPRPSLNIACFQLHGEKFSCMHWGSLPLHSESCWSHVIFVATM